MTVKWYDPRTWRPAPTPTPRSRPDAPLSPGQQGPVRPPESGRLIVTPEEARSIPSDSNVPTTVVDTSPGAVDRIARGGSSSRGGGGSSRSSTGGSSTISNGGTTQTGPIDVSTGLPTTTQTTTSQLPALGTTGPVNVAGLGLTTGAGIIQKGTSFGARQTTPQAGVFITTEKEEADLRKRGIVTYGVSEESFFRGMQTGTGTILPGTQYYGTGRTAGTFQANIESIETSKQIKDALDFAILDFKADPVGFQREGFDVQQIGEGEFSLTATDSFFDGFKVDYRDAYKELGTGVKARLQAGEFGVRVGKLGVGTIESGASILYNLGGAGFMTEESIAKGLSPFKIETLQFTDSTALGRFMKTPTLTTGVSFKDQPFTATWERAKLSVQNPGVLVSDALVVGAVAYGIKGYSSSVKAQGWKVATADAVGVLSPLRIKSGIYTTKITQDTQFDLKSFKAGQSRFFTGQAKGMPEVKISGIEAFGKTGRGMGVSEITAPFAQVRGGGVFTDLGTRAITSSYTFQPLVTGFGLKGQLFTSGTEGAIRFGLYKGGATEVFSKFQDVGVTSTGRVAFKSFSPTATRTVSAGISQTNEAITAFRTGKGIPRYGFTRSEGLQVWEPQTYGLPKTNIRGFQFDLNKIFGSRTGEIGGRITSTGGGTTTLQQTFGTASFPSPQIIIPRITSPPSTSLVPPPTITRQTGFQQSVFTGTGQYELTQATSQIQMPIVGTGRIQDVVQPTRTGSRGRIIPAVIPRVDNIQTQFPRIDIRTSPAIRQDFRQDGITISPTILGFGGIGGFTGTGFGGIGLPLPGIPPRPSWASRKGPTFIGKGPREYTASIGAILRGVKAPKMTGATRFAEQTGFMVRPIISRKGSKKTSTKRKRKKKKNEFDIF
jgi:hypothetical protein